MKRETAETDLALAERKADSDERLSERKAKQQETERKAKDSGEQKPKEGDEGRSKYDAAMLAAVTAMAHAVKQSSAPRTIRKGSDGSYRSEAG